MNKDLDERLIPNGEYRDALNIQVSTSEGSDVGTIQNILGNSLLPNQDFISGSAVCVGSIADEKNDKLYYFIDDDEELVTHPNLDSSTGWSAVNAGATAAEGNFTGTHTFNNDGEFTELRSDNLQLTPGVLYQLTVTIDSISPGAQIRMNQLPATPIVSPKGDTGTFVINFTPGTDGNYVQLTDIRLYMTPWSGFANSAVVSHVSVKKKKSIIVEFDTTTNSITPVLVDTAGDVLNFSYRNIITGINVIDDLLFWTDNQSEPKKINIQRSISGTDPSGTLHTNFENTKTGIASVLKEKHITVIKQGPKLAPAIELISERSNNTDKIYSGIMRITPPPTLPLEYDKENLQNESSMWCADDSTFNHLHDFSTRKVAAAFETQIETDINGESGFTLDWKVGDTLLFKEFGGELFDEIPTTPLIDYSVKAKIIGSSTTSSVSNRFTDEDEEIIQNGDFTIPNHAGNRPKHWGFSSTNTPEYLPNGDGTTNFPLISFNPDLINTTGWTRITQQEENTINSPLEAGVDYNVTVDILNNTNDGSIRVLMVFQDPDDTTKWFTRPGPKLSTDGTYNFTISTVGATSTGPGNDGYNMDDDIGNVVIMTSRPTVSDPYDFNGDIANISIVKTNTDNARIRCKVLALNNPPTVPGNESEIKFVVDKLDQQEKLFEFKFPRFAYRYQYEDREYSTMSPFSALAFLPGSFDYHPKKGYNLGMSNRITSINIKNFVANAPDGVVAVDILYKDDASPGIYVVDTIKPNQDGSIWDDDKYIVTSEQISRILPSNQLLRLWDAVPRKALAQDISGNRIIYGNYVQGHDLKYQDDDYYPDFNVSINGRDNASLNPKKSIKSLREYQLGVVFADEHGRETPVISNGSGTVKVNKSDADKTNEIEVSFGNDKRPSNMKYFKFYIKETSGEYYNLAMDRYYDGEDDHVWISFPSSDRNKIDEDTFLILKKGVESNDMVTQEAKYKILDIKNEAPDFIKQTKTLIEKRTHILATEDLFGGTLADAPLAGNSDFKMNYDQFDNEVGSDLHKIKDSDLYVDFTNATNNVSKRYKIAKITTDYAVGQAVPTIGDSKYSVKLDKKFEDDIDFIVSGGAVKNGTVVNIYKYTVENSAKFDGRFFVKINIDNIFDENINVPSITEVKYRTVLSQKLYCLNNGTRNRELHHEDLTGQKHGVYSAEAISSGGAPYGEHGGFGRFAPFFRNYNKEPDEVKWPEYDGSSSGGGLVEVGQYQFGYNTTTSKPWLQELTWITTKPLDGTGNATTNGGFLRAAAAGSPEVKGGSDTPLDPKKIADKDNYRSRGNNREAEFNEAGEQIHGDVWFIDRGPVAYTAYDNTLNWHPTQLTAKSNNASGMEDGRIDIGIGGIYQAQDDSGADGIGDHNATKIANFFGIGSDGGNPNYQRGHTKSLVSKFYPGQKFRFKEDPTESIYTMQPNIQTDNRLRWHKENPFTVGLVDGTTSVNATDSYLQNSVQLAPNFTKNWKPYFINQVGGDSVNWNPVGEAGIIDNGLKLAINHSATGVWTTGQPFVTVDTLLATDENTGKTHAITTGLILTSHSNGDGYDGDATTDPSEDYLVIKKIEEESGVFKLRLSGYTKMIGLAAGEPYAGNNVHDFVGNIPTASQEMIFQQPRMNGYSQYSVNRINAQHGGTVRDSTTNSPVDHDDGGVMAIGYTLEFIEPIDSEPTMPSNPAIWETEPKESTDLDIYHEASGFNPLNIDSDTVKIVAPRHSTVELVDGNGYIEKGTYVGSATATTDHTIFKITLISPSDDTSGDAGTYVGSLVGSPYIVEGDELKFTKPNGDAITVKIESWAMSTYGANRANAFYVSANLYSVSKTSYTLNWHNCYSFGNGVESNRIRDNFNLPFISNGVKVSTTLDEGYSEERRTGGLIYSGIYNSNSSTNNLNQFIAAEKITKDVNPIYGSIQKLHSRNSDLVTLCEDKCLRILANKDAVYNADGNPQLTANINVLGQTIPFSGEYGISKNPESFASESYRVYFTDKQRGAVMRLSKDGLTPISNHGMRDWFKDNLKLSNKLIGSYDDKKEEYNLTLKEIDNITFNNVESMQEVDAFYVMIIGTISDPVNYPDKYFPTGELVGPSAIQALVGDTVSGDGITAGTIITSIASGSASSSITIDPIPGDISTGTEKFATYPWSTSVTIQRLISSEKKIIGANLPDKTLSFKEDVKGWVSFKSFFPESGINLANNYYTIYNGKLYKHHDENTSRNRFYGTDYNSSVNVILNDGPGSIKSFHTLAYEGSQSRVENIKTTTVKDITDVLDVGHPSTKYAYFDITEFESIIKPNTWSNDEVIIPIKQYRGGVLVYNGDIKAWNLDNSNSSTSMNWGHLRKDPFSDVADGDWLVGDVITTQLQEDSIEHFNMTSKDGWYVSGIETDKQVGNLNEFIEKEGKWFNYIKGIDSDITSETDFGAFDIQGIGMLSSISSDVLTFGNDINASLQVGDIIYFQTPTTNGAFDTIDSSSITKYGDVTAITNDTITVNPTGSAPTADDYIMFAKNHVANTSSLLGYFADVKFENNSTGKVELFSVGSEITESSK